MQPALRATAALVGLVLPLLAGAQGAKSEPWLLVPATERAALGLNTERVAVPIGCGASLLPCRDERAALAARDPSAMRWSVELATLSPAVTNRLGVGSSPRQGLNLSLTGRQPLFGSSFSVYGKLGTSTAWQDGPPVPAGLAGDGSYGLSFGGGLSWDFSPRLSASFGWESQDLRLGTGARDAVRSTTLGLQYRY